MSAIEHLLNKVDSKEALEFSEMVDLFIHRKLNVTNRSRFEQFLLDNNYYEIAGYRFLLRLTGNNYAGYTDIDLIELHEMDKELSNVFFRYIRIVENRLKNSFANCVAKKDKFYLQNPNVYKNAKSRFMRMKHVLSVENKPNKAYLQHYIYNNSHIPVWALVKSFSLGDLLYYIDSFKDVALVKDIFETTMNSKLHPRGIYAKDLLLNIKNFRNYIAHYQRISGVDMRLCASIKSKTVYKKTLFGVGYIMYHYFIPINQQEDFVREVNEVLLKYDRVVTLINPHYSFRTEMKEFITLLTDIK